MRSDRLLPAWEVRKAARQFQGPTGPTLSTWVFHRKGPPIVDFRYCWAEACVAAGVPVPSAPGVAGLRIWYLVSR
jgi:hypothetical protein